MENKNALTVIIPVHNTAQYITRCIESVLNQRLKNVQIIVINDASTDATSQVLLKYQGRENIQLLYSENNVGQGIARNLGINCIKTKFFCFLDSDDWIDMASYQHSVDVLEENRDIDIAVFGIRTEYENSTLSKVRYKYEQNVISGDFALSLLAQENAQDSYISALLGNKVFRTDKFAHLKFTNRHFEDVAYTYKAFASAKNIGLISDVYLHYYQREGSIMHSFSSNYIDDLIDEFVELRQYLNYTKRTVNLKQYYSFFDKCCVSLLNTLFSVEQNTAVQKRFLIQLINTIGSKMPIGELVDYLDLNRIKRLFYI